MRITIFLAALVLSLSLLGSCSIAYAQSPSSPSATSVDDLINNVEAPGAVDIGQSLIHPASPLYFLKAIRERIEIMFDSSGEVRAIRQLEFMQRRLREVSSLVKAKRQDLIPPTLEKYKDHLKIVEDLIQRDEDTQVKVGDAVARHLDVLQRVYDSVGNPQAKAAIRAAIERSEEHNRQLLEKLELVKQQQLIGKIAQRQAYGCKFLVREATSSGLNDTEKEYLKQKVAKCKEDVRVNLKDALEELLQKRLEPATTPSATGR